MLVRQSKNSFIRCTENYGYITNQLTRYDRSYDEYGADILRLISRDPKDIDIIVNELLKNYTNVELDQLKSDVVEFLNSLARDCFVVLGDTIEELDRKDKEFSYSMENPKTMRDDFYQVTDEEVSLNTHEFFLEEVQGRPVISNLQFELSTRCNERCIHCYIPNAKKNVGFDMPLSTVKRIVDEFAQMGGIHVTLSGGEVFLHKYLMEIVLYCREKDLKVSILSNLISLDDSQIPILKSANISLLQTSIYSMNPEIHDFITTVKGSFQRTKSAVEKLVAADIPVQISCPIMKANRIGYEEVMEYARSLKIKSQTDFILMARADLSTDNLANRLSLEETADIIRKIVKEDIKYQKEILTRISPSEEYEFDPERYKKQQVCGVGYDNCCITANGDVYPCAGWQSYVLGNIHKQSLQEIWETSERVKALRKITQADFPQCLECEARNYCMRCLVRNYNESNGDMFAVNHHFCDVAFLTKKIVEEEFGSEYERRERILTSKNC